MLTYKGMKVMIKYGGARGTYKLVFVTENVGNIHVVGGRADIFLLNDAVQSDLCITAASGDTDHFFASEDLVEGNT